jgi:hypothetical protein
MMRNAVARALVGPVFVLSTSGAHAQAAAKDACALLTSAEIQSLDANAKIGSGVGETTPVGTGCKYEWGPRTKEWGESVLSITIIDASKGWPGLNPDVIKQGVLLKVKRGGPNASEIPGVGDAAVFTLSERYPEHRDGTAEAYVRAKGVHLSVTLHGGDLVAKKNQLIALLKAAVARL